MRTAQSGTCAAGKSPGIIFTAGADPVAERDADHPADERQRHRLDQELHEDVAPARADRLADADLARALGDRHQHDVHDADAADEQGDADDRADDGGDAAEDLRVDVEDLVLHQTRKSSALVGPMWWRSRSRRLMSSLTWSTDSLLAAWQLQLHLVGGAAAEDAQRGVEGHET
jgi:hypothetical protein